MADKGGLQLLPETRKKLDIKVPGENRLIAVGVVCILLVSLAGGGLWAYADSLGKKISDADTQIVALDARRNLMTEKSLITLSRQMSVTDQVIKKHTYWSTGFSEIEKALQNNVQFKSFSVALGEQSIHIRALTDNYATLAKQLAAFTKLPAVTDVTLDGVTSLTTGKLDFNAKIFFNSAEFLKK